MESNEATRQNAQAHVYGLRGYITHNANGVCPWCALTVKFGIPNKFSVQARCAGANDECRGTVLRIKMPTMFHYAGAALCLACRVSSSDDERERAAYRSIGA